MTPRAARWQAVGFRALLHIYPAWFRRAHGDEMEQLFLARLDRARRPGAAIALWGRVLRDALETAARVRRSAVIRRPEAGRQGGSMTSVWQDVRGGIRQLIRTPVFALSALALLAVGMGANIAVFTVVDRLLLRMPAYAEPERVVHVYQDSDDGEPSSVSFPAYRDMTQRGVFAAVTATSPTTMTWERTGEAQDLVAEYTTASYIDVVGLDPYRGRWFATEHDVVGAPLVAVVSYAAWRSHFAEDPDVVGRTIRLNGQPVTILGIGPRELTGSYPPIVTDLWLSISSTPLDGAFRVANLDRREDHWYEVRARLAPDASPEAAQAAMQALAAELAERFPDLNRGRDITVRPAAEVGLFEEQGTALWTIAGFVGALLVLACANLANLLLVRGIGRSSEMAVRRALGAGSARIARLYLVESLVLSAAGGVLGLFVAQALLAALPTLPLPFPFSVAMDLSIDGRVGLFAVLVVAAAGVLFGVAPAARSMRHDIAGVLRDGGRTASLGRGTLRLRNALVVIQVAGSLVFVLAAGLLGRSLLAMQGADTGVDADRLAFIRTSPAQAGLTGPEAAQTLEEVRARVEALPGVSRAAVAHRIPAQSSSTTTTIAEGYTPPVGTNAIEMDFVIVSPEYFDTTGLSILEGRGFTPLDQAGGERVVLVSRSTAQRFWGGIDVVGRRLRSQGQPDTYRTVVGVVEDAPVATFPEPSARPMFYLPLAQTQLGAAYIVARTDGDPAALANSLRAAVTDVRSTLPVLAQGTISAHLGAALQQPRFFAQVLAAISALTLVLAALGIYAVVAFNVARRAGELGIRVALGAEPGRVVRAVVGETAGAVALGLGGGLAAAVLLTRQVGSALYGVEALDPVTFAGAVAVLMLVAAVASFVPARRAAHADPARALRA